MMRKSFLGLIVALTGLASMARALDPLPVVLSGRGYKTWSLNQDGKLWRLEDLLHDLRSADRRVYTATLKDLGFLKERLGKIEKWPELEQPIEAKTSFLSFERRKLGVITAPIHGKHQWYLILLRQEGNDEAYWRPLQFFIFDTDPVEGLQIEFPDILGDDIRFLQVRHLGKDDIFGRAHSLALFRYDEKRLRLTWQEFDRYWRAGKFQGDPTRIEQSISFKGDQKFTRTLQVKSWPFLTREEFDKYEGTEPRKSWTVKERFVWNPIGYNFYGDIEELTKLVQHDSPLVRREAARRLGEVMTNTHPQLEKAVLKDKDAYVRMQAALSLGHIGDPKALPTIEKALKNWDEPDTMREAFEKARAALEAKLPKEDAVEKPKNKAPKKKAEAPAGDPAAAPLPEAEGPKVTGAK